MKRRSLLATIPLAALVAACSSTTPATVAQDTAAGVVAAQAILGIATTLQAACATPGACVAAVGTAIATLQQTAAQLSASSTSTDVTSAASTVTGVLNAIAPYVSDVATLLPLISLIHETPWIVRDGQPLIFQIADAPAKPKTQLTAAQVAALKAHLAALAAVVAKARAGV